MRTPGLTPRLLSLMQLMLLQLAVAYGQTTGPVIAERIAVVARSSADSITLRWAPMNFRTWVRGNQKGYRIERYLLSRDGSLLPKPEKTILHAAVRPAPMTTWENPVQHDKYAAIAAQALFGERFEIDLAKSNAFTIVDQVRENEQRFAFALFSADMSPQVAVLSGLWYSDTTVRKNEKYLYRIIINTIDSLRGSVYVGAGDPYELLPPRDLQGDFQDQLVSLRWDRSQTPAYTAFIVERSHDGRSFQPLTDVPLSTIAPTSATDTRYEYATDSIRDMSKTYYYRVRGLTPFGESGPPSQVISGRGQPSVSQVPYIHAVENNANTSLMIKWNFPESDNHAIKGFRVSRASHPTADYNDLTTALLPPEAREFSDQLPERVNYYRVTAVGRNGAPYPSPLYFAQLIDSVPPSAPEHVRALVDSSGTVSLSWQANKEHDVYGYRVFKAWHQSEELTQVTAAPTRLNSYVDTLDLHTLNETVYYSVMAVDNNQNQSPLTGLLRVTLPDRVRPQAPVFRVAKGTQDGIRLEWTQGASEDIVRYLLFRKTINDDKWEQIKAFESSGNVSDYIGYRFLDKEAPAGETSFFTIVSVDDAGLESEPAHPVSVSRPHKTLRPPIAWKKPLMIPDESKIVLKWKYSEQGVRAFRLFRAVDDLPAELFTTLAGNVSEFTDVMIPGRRYSYRILALFADGRASYLSDALKFQY